MVSGSIDTGTETCGSRGHLDSIGRICRGQYAMAQVIMTRKQSVHRVGLHALLENGLRQLALESRQVTARVPSAVFVSPGNTGPGSTRSATESHWKTRNRAARTIRWAGTTKTDKNSIANGTRKKIDAGNSVLVRTCETRAKLPRKPVVHAAEGSRLVYRASSVQWAHSERRVMVPRIVT